jgi:type I restriction enzyme S subunit
MVNAMDKQLIPAGYKQTEVGVIPEDWRSVEINELVENGRLPSGLYKDQRLYGSGTKIIKLGDVFRLDIFDTNVAQRVQLSDTEIKAYKVKTGDIFIALASVKLEGVGKVMYVDELHESTAFDHNVALIRSLETCDSKYLFYILKSSAVRSLVKMNATQVGTSFLKASTILSFSVPIPLKTEQTAITNALSDVDALIAALEKLINKKSAIKTAAMQQLLTGKKRLPPFDQLNTGYKHTELGEIPGDWEIRTIGEISSSYSGGTPSTGNHSFYSGNIPWITSGDLNKERINSVSGRISQNGLENSSAKMVEPRTLLFALYGATAGISAITYIAGAINQAVLAIMPASKYEAEFLFQMFRMRKSFFIETYTQGGQPNFSGEIVKSFAIAIPESLEEQIAIKNVLLDMDKDLEALQQRLYKTQQIKQGMMQELLTGKTRIV